jgi:UPF0755 protein
VLESALVFRLGDRFERLVGENSEAISLKAGEYEFPAEVSAREVHRILAAGEVIMRRLTVPEGLTSHEVLALVSATEGLIGDVAAVPAEGELLPETYHFAFGDSRQGMIERMREDMRTTLAELWPNRLADLPYTTPEEALILASIVQEEAGNSQEMPRVAAVFVNRLRIGMRLESDPTVIYGITGGAGPLGRGLLRSELDQYTPYNTYQIDGLPPTPIANPGRAAIDAVLNPMQTSELFFVADGSGGHVFATTFEEHQQNVARWRVIERQQQSEASSGGGTSPSN